jgi:imidazolonepropionase-like amidohydrolase
MRFRLHLIVAALALPGLQAGAQTEHAYETNDMRVPTLSTGGSCVIRDVMIHTAVRPAFRGDVLVLEGVIVQVGEVTAPPGIVTLEGRGRHLAPGVVDCHSHMAIARGVNEGTVTISCDCDISDSVDPDDMTIYRALAGGVTTARLLHGSANAIGGLHEVIQLKWGRTADELRFPGAREGVKFALGENPKRSNSSRRGSRFPATRLGVAAVYQRAFPRAKEYILEWESYNSDVEEGLDPPPPREDIRLDALAKILSGAIPVHSHCYRADGILMLMRASEQFGFKILTLQHVLEGYKVAKEMADLGIGGSTFGDWWSYKLEAFDAIPQNAALMDEAGGPLLDQLGRWRDGAAHVRRGSEERALRRDGPRTRPGARDPLPGQAAGDRREHRFDRDRQARRHGALHGRSALVLEPRRVDHGGGRDRVRTPRHLRLRRRSP